MPIPAIKSVSGFFNGKFNEGGLPCTVVTTLVPPVFTVLSEDEVLDLTSGDTIGVV